MYLCFKNSKSSTPNELDFNKVYKPLHFACLLLFSSAFYAAVYISFLIHTARTCNSEAWHLHIQEYYTFRTEP